MYRIYNSKFIYNGNEVRIIDTDFFKRVKDYVIRNNFYDIVPLNGADIRSISYQFYGTVSHDWLIYVVNDIVDVYRYDLDVVKVPHVHVIGMITRL